MARARQIMGGFVLEAATPFGREDRERCKELAKVMREAEARRRRPFSESPADRVGDPPGHAERLDELNARLRSTAPGKEPVHCWGGCGRTMKNGAMLRTRGWRSRGVMCGSGREVEVHCPECFYRWGWIEPLHSEG